MSKEIKETSEWFWMRPRHFLGPDIFSTSGPKRSIKITDK